MSDFFVLFFFLLPKNNVNSFSNFHFKLLSFQMNCHKQTFTEQTECFLGCKLKIRVSKKGFWVKFLGKFRRSSFTSLKNRKEAAKKIFLTPKCLLISKHSINPPKLQNHFLALKPNTNFLQPKSLTFTSHDITKTTSLLSPPKVPTTNFSLNDDDEPLRGNDDEIGRVPTNFLQPFRLARFALFAPTPIDQLI